MPTSARNCPRLVQPVGPFSHSVDAGDLVFLSGQVAQDPRSGQLQASGVAEQTHQVLRNFRTTLEDLGLTFASVVKVNAFLVSMSEFATFNAVYAEYFEPPFPARTTVGVAALPLGAQVEIEMIAKR